MHKPGDLVMIFGLDVVWIFGPAMWTGYIVCVTETRHCCCSQVIVAQSGPVTIRSAIPNVMQNVS